jgi:hypothetical protein
LLIALAACSVCFFDARGFLLYYGDAQAHLNISRNLIDARQPGYDQLGTVWLPVLHVICLPFVRNNGWWESGLAGAIPVSACFVFAGLCLYLCAIEVFASAWSALAVLLCFALNPNVLYLSAIPMTEIVFIAGLTGCLLCLLRFRRTQSVWYIPLAVIASWWMSLTRYDGWFLIPFIALFLALSAKQSKMAIFITTGALAALAPTYWLAHNWWETSNPLDFYNGPYSAAAIQGNRPYPGYHDWPQAFHYYWDAGRLCAGNVLLVIGIIGFLTALARRKWPAVAFLSLTPLFYVWSIHSSKTPIHIPILYPFSYYNTRYGIAIVVLTAFAAGAISKSRLALVLPLLTLLPWLIQPGVNHWIVWKESEQNSISRRAWTAEAAAYLDANYQSGQGILTEFGDLAGIFGKAHLPLKEAIHEGSGPAWFTNTMPNGLVRQAQWAMAQEGDKLATRLAESNSYQIVKVITVKDAPRLLIYQRRLFGATP